MLWKVVNMQGSQFDSKFLSKSVDKIGHWSLNLDGIVVAANNPMPIVNAGLF